MSTATATRQNGQYATQEAEEQDLLDQVIANTAHKLDAREAAFMETQLDTAYKRPRSLKNFIQRATEMATLDEQTAASCTYSVPRGNKKIQGASVRLVEICALAWGNLHVDSRVVEIGDKFVKAGAMCWDMQTNNRMGQEVVRNITNKSGGRYTDDMIIVTLNAAMSIALRNAILRVIPRSYVEMIRMKAVEVVRGDVRTLTKRRDDCVKHWGTQGVDQARVLAALGRASVEEIDLDDIVTLRGFDTAIKSGEAKIDECFPPVTSPATALPSGRVRVTNLPKEEPASEPPTDEHGEIKDGPASAETLNRIQAQLVELNQPAPSYRKLHGIKSFADLTQSQAEQHVAMLDDQILVRSKKPARDTAALPGVPEPEDSTLLERADAILRIREALKEKSLTEKAACGWVKPPLAKLEDATAEQLQAIEAELAKRT